MVGDLLSFVSCGSWEGHCLFAIPCGRCPVCMAVWHQYLHVLICVRPFPYVVGCLRVCDFYLGNLFLRVVSHGDHILAVLSFGVDVEVASFLLAGKVHFPACHMGWTLECCIHLVAGCTGWWVYSLVLGYLGFQVLVGIHRRSSDLVELWLVFERRRGLCHVSGIARTGSHCVLEFPGFFYLGLSGLSAVALCSLLVWPSSFSLCIADSY